MNPSTCPDCGKPLPAGAPAGPCAACLLKLGEQSNAVDDRSTALDEVKLTEGAGAVIGRYKLLEKLGEGGFGAVWAAEQREPVRRRVALKIIKLGMDTRQVVARFEAERQALALMDHPNIAKVLDAGTTDTGRPFFVMELVRGIPITKYCDHEKLGTKDRLDLFIKVCQAIQHAHQKGIIHRDIKPSNIMVTLHDGVPVPKVIDFGIAKATQQELTELTIYTQLHQFIGTPAYMSPEQAEMSGLDIDTRSDIYSLGVLLYELLTGKTPFDAKELMKSGVDEMRRIICEQEPVRPSTRLSQTLVAAEVRRLKSDDPKTAEVRASSRRLLREIQGDLDWIVMKCLEKDRQRRYETANGLAADLKRHLNNEPVVARPPSAAYRLRKTYRRHRLALSAVAAVILALVGGIAVSTWLAILTGQERRVAQAERDRALGAQRQAERAREAEEQARERAEAGEASLQQMSFQLAFDRGLALCEQGKVREGMLWLARTLELAPPGEVALRRVVLENLAAWRYRVHPLRNLFDNRHHVVVVDFSPDGSLLLTGCGDGTARLWEAGTGRLIREFAGHQDHVHGLSFSPDGGRIATASWDGTAQIWELQTGDRIGPPFVFGSQVHVARFSPDGTSLLITGSAPGARIYDAETRELKLVLPHRRGIHDAVFSPDGTLVLTAGGDDHQAHLWRITPQVEKIASFPHGFALLVGFSRDQTLFATGGQDKTAQLWQLESRERLGPPLRHFGHPHVVTFSPDGALLATAVNDNTARLWEVESGEAVEPPFEHIAPVSGVAFSPEGSFIATGSTDGIAGLWHFERRARPLGAPLRHDHPLSLAAFNHMGNQVLTVSQDEKARIWQVAGHRLLREFDHGARVLVAGLSPDGRRAFTSGEDGRVRLWNLSTGQAVGALADHQTQTGIASFSRDGTFLLTVSGDSLRLWDADSGEVARPPLDHPSARLTAAALSPDNSLVVTGCFDHQVRLLRWETGEILHTWSHQSVVRRVAFHPKGSLVASASEDNTVRLWDPVSGQPYGEPFRHTGPLEEMAFNADGTRILTTASRSARLWDVATGRPIGGPYAHASSVRGASISPDGSRIVTAAADGLARFWSVATDPVPDHVEAVRLWVEVLTGMELNAAGTLQFLSPETWRQRRKALEGLGGLFSRWETAAADR
jgi:eukaryotic-like serine/threonine-protein kinase